MGVVEVDDEEKYIEANTGILEPGDSSPEYLSWVQSKYFNLPPLTKTQKRFAEWLLTQEQYIGHIGLLTDVFSSVRRYLKNKSK